jgi:hypothetical protein
MSDELKELQRRRAEQKALLDESLRGKTDEERLIIKQTPAYRNNLNILKEINEQVKDIQENNKTVVDTLMQQESKLKGLKGIQASLVTLDRERITAQQTLSGDTQEAINSIAAMNQELLSMSAEDTIGRELVKKQINEALDTLRENNEVSASIVSNLEQQRDIATKISNLSEKQQEFLGKQLAVYEGIQDTIAGVMETASLLTSNLGGMFGGALIGAGFFVDKLGETTKALGGMRDIGTTALSFIDDNAVENAKALSKEFGGMNNVSADLQVSTSLISKNMGISGTEAASLLGNFSRLNGNSTEVAKDLMASTQEFAKQNGIIPSELMGELANNTEAFALYGKDGGKNIIEAAGYAKKLGVEFGKLTGLADNLLDFESSITNELELGAMLGKNINLDKARQLAFAGDIEGMTKETLKALGGVEAFNKMDPIAKKKTAELLGVSVEELSKMVTNQKEADTLSGKLNKEFSLLSESTSYIANEWGGGILKAFGSGIIAIAQMGGGLAQMGVDVKGMASRIPILGRLFKGSTTPTPPTIPTPPTPPTPQIPTPDGPNPASRGGIMDSLSKIKMSDVLKGAAAMLIVAAAVFVFAKAVQEFMEVSWEAVGMAVVSMLALVGAIALLGMIMSSGVGAVAILAGAAAMLIVAASVLVLGVAIQSIGKGFEMLSNGISTLVPNLVSVGSTIASLVLFIPAIGLLSLALMGLAASLTALGLAGILAGPGLMALAAVGTIAIGVGSLLGIGGEDTGGEAGGNDTMQILVDEIRGLREDLKSGKIGVYMDGTAVASKVSRVVDRIGVNSYS